MFEQSMLTSEAPARRAWSLGASLAVQTCLLVLVSLAPLFFTYRLPLDALGRSMTLLLAPEPPAPPPPPTVKVTPRAPPRRFEAVLRQPRAIPDEIALVEEDAPVALAMRPPDGTPGGVVGGIPVGLAEISGLRPPLVPRPILVGGRVQAARLLERVLPAYPVEAREQSISGRVLLSAVIGTDGAVKDLRLVEGHPLLAPPAIEAVSQWRYKPTLLNGVSVEVITEIEVNFKLTPPSEEDAKSKKKRRRRN